MITSNDHASHSSPKAPTPASERLFYTRMPWYVLGIKLLRQSCFYEWWYPERLLPLHVALGIRASFKTVAVLWPLRSDQPDTWFFSLLSPRTRLDGIETTDRALSGYSPATQHRPRCRMGNGFPFFPCVYERGMLYRRSSRAGLWFSFPRLPILSAS